MFGNGRWSVRGCIPTRSVGTIKYIVTGEQFENVASNATELAYLRQCRALATKRLAQQGLDGLNFSRISNGIEWPEQQPEHINEGENG